jgi:hypothetical protein
MILARTKMEPSHRMLVFQIIFPAIAGLGGVAVGGWITIHSQKIERQHERIREQLSGFYSVLLGMRSRIRAKSEVRLKVRNLAEKVQRDEEFQKLLEYDKRQLQEELVPLYREILDHVTKNMWLAEPSTLTYYGPLVEYVEVWNRSLGKTLPTDVAFEIDHDEEKLYPFYEDLKSQFERLQAELKK